MKFFFPTHFQTSFFTLWNLTQRLNMKISKTFGTTCHICSIKHKCWMKEKKRHPLHFCDSKSHLKNILHVLFCIIVKHTFNCTPFKNLHWLLFAMWIFNYPVIRQVLACLFQIPWFILIERKPKNKSLLFMCKHYLRFQCVKKGGSTDQKITWKAFNIWS